MKPVIFINPPLFFDSNGQAHSLDASRPPLGILYLATCLQKQSKLFYPIVLDSAADKKSLNQILKFISRLKPFAVNISAMTPQLQGAYTIAKSIKKQNPDQTIILGGPHISADPDFINRHPRLFDYAVTGEAELTLVNSLNKLHRRQSIPRLQAGQIVKNLDKLPIPNRRLINRSAYKKTESLIFSRGCPYHCYYCSRPAINRQVRYRSASNLITEIKKTHHYHHGHLDFQDDTFTLKKQPVINFCRQVLDQKLKLSWSCNTRIDAVTPQLLKLMSQAGCNQINFGIESASQKLRRQIINKGNFSNRQILHTLTICRQLGIKVAAYFMIGHPTETKNQIRQTKNMILSYPIDILGLSIPLPFPGAPLYNIALKQGIISTKIIDKFASGHLGLGYSGIYPQYHPQNIPLSYLHQQMRQINQAFYFRPRIIYQNLKNIPSHLPDLISLIKYGMSSRKPYKK